MGERREVVHVLVYRSFTAIFAIYAAGVIVFVGYAAAGSDVVAAVLGSVCAGVACAMAMLSFVRSKEASDG